MGGKERVSRIPEKIARRRLRRNEEADLVGGIMKQGYRWLEVAVFASSMEPGGAARETMTFSILRWSPF